MLQKWSHNAEERCRIIAVHLRQSDTIAAIAHIYAAMRSLHMHTCTHTHTNTAFCLAVSTHTYSAIYNRCRSTQTYTAKRSLQRLNRWSIISAKAHDPPKVHRYFTLMCFQWGIVYRRLSKLVFVSRHKSGPPSIGEQGPRNLKGILCSSASFASCSNASGSFQSSQL